MTTPAQRATHPALPFEIWPAEDREAWMAAIRPKQFLRPAGRGAAWRPASRRSAMGAYGRWLGWLFAQDVDLLSEAAAARMTAKRLEAYAHFLLEGRSSVTAASTFGVLCMAVIAMFPEADWDRLRSMQKELRSIAKPSRIKRLVPAHDLFQLGIDLLAVSAETLDRKCDADLTARQISGAARDYRDGLMIALLASRPLRISNFVGMEIGTHLRQTRTRTTIEFRPQETKTSVSILVGWPDEILEALGRYLQEVRPMLIEAPPTGGNLRPPCGPGCRLWVGQGGTRLSPGGLDLALARHTLSRFGFALSAHRFRDSVATTIVDQNPSDLHLAAQILGHKRLSTTERHYVREKSAGAVAGLHDLIASMRRPVRGLGCGSRVAERKSRPSRPA